MQLFGSDTSPYARRIRLFIAHHALDIDYIHLDIFSDAGRKELIAHNPARKIPFLVNGSQQISDSNVIFRYLNEHYDLPRLTWWQENQLTNINACNDSLVELLICDRSGFDTNSDALFFNLQRERIEQVLLDLNEQCVKTHFLDCQYLQISLYCLLDWIVFRELTDLTSFAALLNFHTVQSQRKGVKQSDPRN
ncbi:glutathione S-transferase [Pseudoalteromonas citrea]|uniref:Glutathione S-transferase n=1 Tax=Pseudoalteromonas citrea TaxID=43655 RepID=A0A5S3XT21_9GAMM|nr:glutathione S-transferase family protein [Pseudoalteromonas citrea]TMP45127.1 glutathione S-transferase [Pseudoalteromonas citrea]TMP61492.1 glutathione S-transferase [Pseudoalteromonas citrea]